MSRKQYILIVEILGQLCYSLFSIPHKIKRQEYKIMARKPDTFIVDEKKKVITIYTNVEIIEAEERLKNYYLQNGYTPLFGEKKKSISVEEMRKELADDEETLKAFNEAYKEKTKAEKGKKVDFKATGFAKACKIYNNWKKAQKKAEAETKSETETKKK